MTAPAPRGRARAETGNPVADDETSAQRQRVGDVADALALPPEEFVRIAVERLGLQAHLARQFADLLFELGAGRDREIRAAVSR